MTSVVTPWRTLGSWRGLGEDHQPGVRVKVDEAGRDHFAAGVDPPADSSTPPRPQPSTRRLSPTTAMEPGRPGRAGAIDDGAVLDQQVDRHCR